MKIFNLKQDKEEIKQFYRRLKQSILNELEHNPIIKSGLNSFLIAIKWLIILSFAVFALWFLYNIWVYFEIAQHTKGLDELEIGLEKQVKEYENNYSFPLGFDQMYTFLDSCAPYKGSYISFSTTRPQEYNQPFLWDLIRYIGYIRLDKYFEEIENYKNDLRERTNLLKERASVITTENTQQAQIKKEVADKLLISLNLYNERLKEYEKYFSTNHSIFNKGDQEIDSNSFSQVKDKCKISEIKELTDRVKVKIKNFNEKIDEKKRYYNSLDVETNKRLKEFGVDFSF